MPKRPFQGVNTAPENCQKKKKEMLKSRAAKKCKEDWGTVFDSAPAPYADAIGNVPAPLSWLRVTTAGQEHMYRFARRALRLQVVQLAVVAVESHQLVVIAALNDASLVQDTYFVGILYG